MSVISILKHDVTYLSLVGSCIHILAKTVINAFVYARQTYEQYKGTQLFIFSGFFDVRF